MSGAEASSLPTWDKYLTERYGSKALFTYAEACDILGCSRPTLCLMVSKGELDVRHLASSPRITRTSIISFLQNRPSRKR